MHTLLMLSAFWFLLAMPVMGACFVARASRIPQNPFWPRRDRSRMSDPIAPGVGLQSKIENRKSKINLPPRSKAASPAAGISNVDSTHQKDRIEGENCPARAEGSPQYGGCAPGFLFRLRETDCQANERCALRRRLLSRLLS